MMNQNNGQQPNPPCYICGQEVRKAHGMVGAEGPLCSRDCARVYFLARQVAGVRGSLVEYLKAQQQKSGLVVPRS